MDVFAPGYRDVLVPVLASRAWRQASPQPPATSLFSPVNCSTSKLSDLRLRIGIF